MGYHGYYKCNCHLHAVAVLRALLPALAILLCYVICLAAQSASLSSRLLLKLLSAVEDVKQTQRLHSSMLQSLMKQLQAPTRDADAKLPEDVNFPLHSTEGVDNLERHLQDAPTKAILVNNSRVYFFTYRGHRGYCSPSFTNPPP